MIGCRDECGRKVADTEEAAQQSWEYLEIQKRWRCPSCRAELAKANEQGKEPRDER